MNISKIDRESIGEQVRQGTFRLPRRSVMKTAALATAGASAGLLPMMSSARAATVNVTDGDVLNFALNLEYLEANYYLLGVTGKGLPVTAGGVAPLTPTTTLVPFQTSQLASYFERIAADENAHVSFLVDALGSDAIPQPAIDLDSSFTSLAVSAGLIAQGQTFNPFASEIDFIIGSYIFEDVGVTAYAGGASYLQLNGPNIPYAASILAMEGYHAGAIRGYLASQGGGAVTNAISALRNNLSGGVGDDNGTDLSASGGNPFNIVNGDSSGQVYRRTFNQVLSIVYGSATAATKGLFFPNGVNGEIASSGDTFVSQNG